MDHADSADSKAGSHIRLVCRTLGLGGMLHCHDDAGMVTHGAFPFMHVSKC